MKTMTNFEKLMRDSKVYYANAVNFDELLLSSFRLFPIVVIDRNITTNESLVKAMTINEELINLGYTLSPKGILMLANSPSIEHFLDLFKTRIGSVDAAPMYPNFPSQVMAMDEAVFRFHQLLHYMSTYGVELMTGQAVSKGWMPDVESTAKVRPDDNLLMAKVIELIDENDKYLIPYERILGKTERVDDKERVILESCVKNMNISALSSTEVKFKENLIPIFETIWTMDFPSSTKLAHLHMICQHTGDVLKCLAYFLHESKYRLHTSQKRLAVKLFESYPIEDFSENIIRSGKERENALRVLRYTDFNEYARNKQFIEAVRALRNDELKSWEGKVKALVSAHDPSALAVYATRPGIMLRHLTYLLRNGYSAEDIEVALGEKAGQLKTQTIMSLINHFGRECIRRDTMKKNFKPAELLSDEPYVMYDMLKFILKQNLFAKKINLGKKVYIDEVGYDFGQSMVDTEKSSEGGYIRSGIAYQIPNAARRIRFFIYWNDEEKVDVDLHSRLVAKNGGPIDIGWNARYVDDFAVFSGDITHSDAAEYIDIDLDKAADKVARVNTTICLYSGKDSFREIETCFVGAMAVSNIGEDVKLYDPKNCFFSHNITGDYFQLKYAYIDVENRTIIFIGKKCEDKYDSEGYINPFPLKDYLDMLFKAQGIQRVFSPDDADTILVMGKPSKDKEVSLIDNNFFMDA